MFFFFGTQSGQYFVLILVSIIRGTTHFVLAMSHVSGVCRRNMQVKNIEQKHKANL